MAALGGLCVGADVRVHWVKLQCLTKSRLREEAPHQSDVSSATGILAPGKLILQGADRR